MSGTAPITPAPHHTGEIPVLTGPPIAPPLGDTGWRKAHTWTLIGAFTGVALVAGIALFAVEAHRPSAAEELVSEYFTRLADHDGRRAGELVADAVGDTVSPMWTDGVLDAGYTPPEDVSLSLLAEAVPPGMDQDAKREYATVVATYTVAGRPATELFTLDDGGDGDWRITSVRLGVMRLGDEYTPFRVAATEGAGVMWVPSGTYRVSITDDPLFEDMADDVPVTSTLLGATGRPPLSVVADGLTVRAEAAEEVEAQVRRLVDACATYDVMEDFGSRPSQCPWKSEKMSHDPFFNGPWDVVSYPEIEVAVDDTGIARVTTVTAGEAVLDGDTDVTVPLTPIGAVYQNEGEITFVSEDPNR
ncbi:hypothetical protein LX16_3428 [Stackebrandtia albiflava]|uniref:Uncharacterized protein n=1 Tax=Stackebrandtia albiflava TaxID=406432 RepID=A0A562V463_9ACTN|nr:hypothetical protein [Stackebrandtia albiflava]TWJ12666.1 hypothetical protein LX16_3428 [Stackebrandtia albiflava]